MNETAKVSSFGESLPAASTMAEAAALQAPERFVDAATNSPVPTYSIARRASRLSAWGVRKGGDT
jgi:hypothetical protein